MHIYIFVFLRLSPDNINLNIVIFRVLCLHRYLIKFSKHNLAIFVYGLFHLQLRYLKRKKNIVRKRDIEINRESEEEKERGD